ncbi:MAG TPA: lytic transglycosylase domain-containing protein [Nitrospira sp.]|nr:lytic transglycosylase domain-containing protein [Nitrospira sp.]
MQQRWLGVMLAAILAVVLPASTKAQPQTDPASKDAPPTPSANGESDRDLILSDPLDNANEPEDRLVILPEIKRDGERFYLSAFKLPDKLTFAGQPVPLDNWQVRERIEYEFYQFLEDQGESIVLAKRTGRCFPPAERQLAEAGLPDDLKYMLLVESKCISAAYSRAKASGPWQFMPSTGRRYRLKSDAVRDERRNLEMSTEAAVKYLKYLKDFQQNDWFMAMASYNAGEERIRKLLKEQKITDYWKMHGPRETMRYVPRIIAAKEIYSQPEKYLGLSKKDLYLPLETETITVNVKEPQRALTSIAEEFGTYFLELKLLNPEFKKDFLPHGTYQIKVPRQTCPSRCFKQEKIP